MQPEREDGQDVFTIYFAKWCGTCKTVVPKLTTVAMNAGLGVRLVDVEDPTARELCSHVRWVPYIEHNGSEISIKEFLQLISELTVKED
jgi:thiol-disulfide isomerase/thioredoxin